MIRLSDLSMSRLLPGSIADDTAFRAAAVALDPLFARIVRSIPNLLLWHRLAITAGRPTPGMLHPISRIVTAAGGLKPLDTETLELLAWQFHVDFREVARSDAELAKMIIESIPWHRIKGTPDSITRALALFGIAATIEEDGAGEDWATYQLGVSGTPDIATLKTAYEVVREMAPVRCRLFRIYNDLYDFRPICFSDGPNIGDGWLSFYSGVKVPGIGGDEDAPLVSFGAELSLSGEPLRSRVWSGLSASLNLDGMYEDCFIVGTSCFSDVFPQNHSFVFRQLFSWQNAERVTASHKWRGKWNRRHWTEPVGWTRVIPPWEFGMLTLYKSELRIGWPDDNSGLVHGSGTIGDINACAGIRSVRHFDDPFIIGDSLLSEHDPDLHDDLIEEYFIAPTIAVGAPVFNPPAPHFGRNSVCGLFIAPLHDQGWNGTWRSKRRWWNYQGGCAAVTTTPKE